MKSSCLLAAVAVVAAGCAVLPSVGPSYEGVELETPECVLPDAGMPTTNLMANYEYQVAEAGSDSRIEVSNDLIAQWWTRFDDPVLCDLVQGAVTNNLGYLQAIARLEKARYELLGSYAAFLPKFGIGALWNRNWAEKNASSTGLWTDYASQKFAVDGNWEIDIFGGNRRASEAALAQAEAEGWSVADAWVALTTTIGKQYVNLRTTQALLEVARTNLILQSETYDILKSRLDSGIGDELAVNQCAYIVEQTRAAIPTLLANEESIKNALAILVGGTPGELAETLAPLPKSRDWLLPPQKVAELKLNLVRARPDVKAAERALAAQVARIGVAKASWFPKLFISGAVGWQNNDSQRLFSKDSFFATLGPSVSWPIFQGGAIWANVKATEARTLELTLAYEQAVNAAYGEVRNAYSAYTQEYHRYRSLGEAVKAATDAVLISQDLYKNGLKDFNNVLDAQRSRLSLEEQFVRSRGQITLDLIELYRALGGGLAVPES